MTRFSRFVNRFNRLPWRCSLGWPILLFALFGGFGAALLGSIGGYLLGLVISPAAGGDPTVPVATMAIGQNLVASLFLLVWFLVWPPRRKLAAKLGIRPLKGGDCLAVVIGMAVILLIGGAATAGWQTLLDCFGIPCEEKQDVVQKLAEAGPAALIGIAAGTVIGAPLAEEILFRRVLFGLLRPLGAVSAVLLTSLVFSLIHFFLLGIPELFLMGLTFHVIYIVRRNLLSAMLMHCIVNLAACVSTLLFPEAAIMF